MNAREIAELRGAYGDWTCLDGRPRDIGRLVAHIDALEAKLSRVPEPTEADTQLERARLAADIAEHLANDEVGPGWWRHCAPDEDDLPQALADDLIRAGWTNHGQAS